MMKLSKKITNKFSLLLIVCMGLALSACKKDETPKVSGIVKVLKTQNPLEGQLKALKKAENLEAELLKLAKDRRKLMDGDL